MRSVNGFYRLRNLGSGADLVGKVKVLSPFSFAMGTRGSARHLSGKRDNSPEKGKSTYTNKLWGQFVSDRQVVR